MGWMDNFEKENVKNKDLIDKINMIMAQMYIRVWYYWLVIPFFLIIMCMRICKLYKRGP